MEIDFLGLKKKGVSELVGRKTETDGDSGGGQKWISSIPGCSYSGLNEYLRDSSHPPEFSSVKSVTSLGKKSYCKAFDLNFSEKGVPVGVMSKCAGSSTSQPQEVDAIERILLKIDNIVLTGKNANLTMFYANSVYVFDDISPEKAKAILSMAEHDRYATFELVKTEVSKKPVSHFPLPSSITNSSRFPPETRIFGTVPQARKASLFRFLEKRKHRLKGVIPFNLTTNPSSSSDCSYPLASASFMQKANH